MKESKTFVIKKETSDIIKGFAILLMFVHHFITFPSFIIEDYRSQYEIFAVLNSPTKLCVCVFAFITGWAFCISKKKKLTDIMIRLIKFLIVYWLAAIPIIIFAVALCGFAPSPLVLVLEFFGVTHNVMIFCWYVLFYIISMLLMFCIYRLLNKNIWLAVILGVIVPIVVFMGLMAVNPIAEIDEILNNLKHWFPCVSAGYICCRYNLFAYPDKLLNKVPNILLVVVGIAICGVGRYYVSSLDVLYCCILVFVLSCFVQNTKDHKINRAISVTFKSFGKASTNMWFWHCLLFSSVTRSVVQPYLWFLVQFPLLFLLVGTVCLFFVVHLWNLIDKKILSLLHLMGH